MPSNAEAQSVQFQDGQKRDPKSPAEQWRKLRNSRDRVRYQWRHAAGKQVTTLPCGPFLPRLDGKPQNLGDKWTHHDKVSVQFGPGSLSPLPAIDPTHAGPVPEPRRDGTGASGTMVAEVGHVTFGPQGFWSIGACFKTILLSLCSLTLPWTSGAMISNLDCVADTVNFGNCSQCLAKFCS